jgi:hypothetical protein
MKAARLFVLALAILALGCRRLFGRLAGFKRSGSRVAADSNRLGDGMADQPNQRRQDSDGARRKLRPELRGAASWREGF